MVVLDRGLRAPTPEGMPVVSRSSSLTFVLVLALSAGCARDIERLGNGYKLVRRAEIAPPDHWEGIAHYRHLVHRGRELGRVGFVSIAPTGRYALVEMGGRLLLHDARSRSLTDVTEGKFEIPSHAVWRDGVVTVHFFGEAERAPIDIGIDASLYRPATATVGG